ncbi:hypothetical protein D3C80_1595500 [compost metagenome]
MLTSPLETSLARAAIMISTNASTMPVNMPIAIKISKLIIYSSLPYNCTPEKDMKPRDIRPMVIKVMPKP